MNSYIHKRKIFSKVIMITFYITFVCYLLGDVQSITNINYSLHEMLYIPYNVAIFILPILTIGWLYFAIKSLGFKQEKLKYKDYIKNFIIIISLIGIFIYFIIQQQSVSTGGIFLITNKVYDGNNYYVEVNEMKIKCTWNEFNLIEEGKTYLIDYEWNTYWPDKGKLEYIELLR